MGFCYFYCYCSGGGGGGGVVVEGVESLILQPSLVSYSQSSYLNLECITMPGSYGHVFKIKIF